MLQEPVNATQCPAHTHNQLRKPDLIALDRLALDFLKAGDLSSDLRVIIMLEVQNQKTKRITRQ